MITDFFYNYSTKEDLQMLTFSMRFMEDNTFAMSYKRLTFAAAVISKQN